MNISACAATRVFGVALLTSFGVACSSDDAASSGDGYSVEVVASMYSPIAASIEVTSDAPVTVEVTAVSGTHVVRTPAPAEPSTDVAIPLVGMRAERTYDLEVDVTDEAGRTLGPTSTTFTTAPLPYPLPSFEVWVDETRSQPGITLIEYNPSEPPDDDEGGPILLGLDAEGEVVYWYRNTGALGGVEPTSEGTFISHYFPVGVREFDLLGNVVGNWQVSPERMDEPVEFRDADALAAAEAMFAGNDGDMDAAPVKADWVDLTSFHHEAFRMPNGNILALATTNHDLTEQQRETFCPGDPKDFRVTSDVVVEFERDGNVVRTWDLWDAIDIDEVPGPALCSTDEFFESEDFRDWTHANAVIYDQPRDAILVSSRHTDQVIAFDHLDDTGAQSSVRWILGQDGTIPLQGEPFHHAHAVELEPDGSILLYDNGNLRPGTTEGDPDRPTYSRAVWYTIDDRSPDPTEWSASQRWEHRVDDIDGEPLYAFFLGDADRLDNGNVLIDHGGIRIEDETDRATIIEVVPDGASGGDVVWELILGDVTEPVTVYRAERLPSFHFGPYWSTP